MRNLKPIGIPHSIILENLFARTFDASKLDEDTERVRQAYHDRGYFKAQTSEPTDARSRRRRLESVHAAAVQGQAHRYSDAG